jgi:O-antigen/teichoic acid export membrane protein
MMRRTLISTFGVTGLVMGLTVITSVVLARNLGPEGRGLLLALTFWPALWAALSNLSLNEATCLHVAQSAATGGEEAHKAFESSGLTLQLIMAFVTAAVAMALIALLLPGNRREYLDLLLGYTAAFASLSTLDQHFKAVLQGRGAFGRLNVIRLVQPSVYMLVLLILIHSASLSVSLVMAAIIAALAGSTALAAASAGVHISAATLTSAKVTLASGWRFHLANVLLYGAAEIDKLLVLQLLNDHDIGLYAVAVAVGAVGGGLVVQSLGLILTRQIAAAAKGDVAKLTVRAIHDATLLLVLVNSGAALLAPWLIPMLFGAEFAPAVPTVFILLGSGALRGLRQIIDRAMRAARVTSVGMVGEGVALIATMLFAAIGGFIGGLEGLAAGLVVAQAVALTVMLIMTIRILNIPPAELSPLNRINRVRLGQAVRREMQLARGFWR